MNEHAGRPLQVGLARHTDQRGPTAVVSMMHPLSNDSSTFMLKETAAATHRCNHYGKKFSSSCADCMLQTRRPRPSCGRGTTAFGKNVSPSVKVHQCRYCAYTTNFTTNLINHMRTHTGEKPFQCPHCPYRANQRTNLTMHMRTHTGEKPYACSHCPYRSSRKDALRSHLLKHTSMNEAADPPMS